MSDQTTEKTKQSETGGTDRAFDLSQVRRRVRPGSVATVAEANAVSGGHAAATLNTQDSVTLPEASNAAPTTIIKTKHGRKEVAYETGYGLPPKSGQFKPGQSGNRKGRPKGSVNLRTAMEDLYHRQTEIRRNGKTVKMPLFQVILEQDAMKAASGEAKAIQRVRSDFLKLMGFEEARIAKGKDAGGGEPTVSTATGLTDSERHLLRHFKKIEYATLGFAADDIEDLLDLDFGPDKPVATIGIGDISIAGVDKTAAAPDADDPPEDDLDGIDDDEEII